MSGPLSRRSALQRLAGIAALLGVPGGLRWSPGDPDLQRLLVWTGTLRHEQLTGTDQPFGCSAVRVGELATGTPYVPGTLDAYLKTGGPLPSPEPLTLSLTQFDCVTLVEACLGVARVAAMEGAPTWDRFATAIETMRYRGGRRGGYSTRLHYFSEWIADGERRGLVRNLGQSLGGSNDTRPLRFMTEHRASYPALTSEAVFEEIATIERRLDGAPRWVVAPSQLPAAVSQIESGDVLSFATSIPGLDVTHAALAYRDQGGVLRVLHAPLSGGVVEITRTTLVEYVAAIRRCTGVYLARPLR
jgi:hypothetical protein